MEERERYSNGLEVRRAVLGDAHVDQHFGGLVGVAINGLALHE